jgi:DNA-binding CsgD family transcriptional regulator
VIEIFKSKFTQFEKKIKSSFSKIRDELDEHLDTINQNTSEIQANYEYIFELENKVEKLNQRLDEMQMMLENGSSYEYKLETPPSKLTKREEEVFMILYTDQGESLTFSDVARKTGLKEDMVKNYISSISSKGVPIIQKFVSGKSFISIEPSFKNLQIKENVLGFGE